MFALKPRFALSGVCFSVFAPVSLSAQAPSPPSIAPEVRLSLDAGDNAYASRQWEKAVGFYQEARRKARQSGSKAGEAAALLGWGDAIRAQNHLTEAAAFYEQALPLAREAKDRETEAEILNNCGLTYSNFGEFQKAQAMLNLAVPLYGALKNKDGEAMSTANLGRVYRETGELQKALDCFQHSLALVQETKNRYGQAVTFSNLGQVYTRLGEPKKALEAYSQSLSLRLVLKDKHGEGVTLDSIGLLYDRIGQPQKAIEFFNRSLPLIKASGDKLEESVLYNNLAVSYDHLGLRQKSLELYQQTLTLEEEIGGKAKNGTTLLNIGSTYLALGQLPKAQDFYERALVRYRAAGNRIGEGETLNNLGLILEKTGQTAKALQFFEESVRLGRATENLTGKVIGLSHLARLENSLHRSVSAEAHILEAVQLLEKTRTNFEGYTEAKSLYLAGWLPSYSLAVELLIKNHKAGEAFALAQKTKARSLLDLLASGHVTLDAALTSEERTQEAALRKKAALLNAQMVQQGVENQIGAKKRFADLKVKLKAAESELQTFTDALYARYPLLAQKRIAETASAQEVVRLLPPDTALLEYLTSPGQPTRLFVITSEGIQVFSSALFGQNLANRAAAFHSLCANPHRDYQEAASAFYALLIRPAERALQSKKRLIVCPDGALWDVPFAALMPSARKTKFLADRFEIAYAYSATGAEAAMRQRRRLAPAPKTLLVCADPDFGATARFGDLPDVPGQRPLDAPSRPIDSPARPLDAPTRPLDSPARPLDSPARPLDSPARKMEAQLSRGKTIAALPGTRLEAEAISRLFPGALILTGKAAQETEIKAKMGEFRFVHLATHGFVNDAAPLLSSVVLAQPNPGSPDDGFLTAREIYDLSLRAELVVLSACNTARGEIRSGEGVIGLSWALQAAGCPSEVVSAWAVDDASTAALMSRFYRNLIEQKQGKGKALQSAAFTLRQNRRYRHPYYWAPFFLMGDWR